MFLQIDQFCTVVLVGSWPRTVSSSARILNCFQVPFGIVGNLCPSGKFWHYLTFGQRFVVVSFVLFTTQGSNFVVVFFISEEFCKYYSELGVISSVFFFRVVSSGRNISLASTLFLLKFRIVRFRNFRVNCFVAPGCICRIIDVNISLQTETTLFCIYLQLLRVFQ